MSLEACHIGHNPLTLISNQELPSECRRAGINTTNTDNGKCTEDACKSEVSQNSPNTNSTGGDHTLSPPTEPTVEKGNNHDIGMTNLCPDHNVSEKSSANSECMGSEAKMSIGARSRRKNSITRKYSLNEEIPKASDQTDSVKPDEIGVLKHSSLHNINETDESAVAGVKGAVLDPYAIGGKDSMMEAFMKSAATGLLPSYLRPFFGGQAAFQNSVVGPCDREEGRVGGKMEDAKEDETSPNNKTDSITFEDNGDNDIAFPYEPEEEDYNAENSDQRSSNIPKHQSGPLNQQQRSPNDLNGASHKRGYYKSYTRDQLMKALEAVQTAKMSGEQAAKFFKVPRSTLHHHLRPMQYWCVYCQKDLRYKIEWKDHMATHKKKVGGGKSGDKGEKLTDLEKSTLTKDGMNITESVVSPNISQNYPINFSAKSEGLCPMGRRLNEDGQTGQLHALLMDVTQPKLAKDKLIEESKMSPKRRNSKEPDDSGSLISKNSSTKAKKDALIPNVHFTNAEQKENKNLIEQLSHPFSNDTHNFANNKTISSMQYLADYYKSFLQTTKAANNVKDTAQAKQFYETTKVDKKATKLKDEKVTHAKNHNGHRVQDETHMRLPWSKEETGDGFEATNRLNDKLFQKYLEDSLKYSQFRTEKEPDTTDLNLQIKSEEGFAYNNNSLRTNGCTDTGILPAPSFPNKADEEKQEWHDKNEATIANVGPEKNFEALKREYLMWQKFCNQSRNPEVCDTSKVKHFGHYKSENVEPDREAKGFLKNPSYMSKCSTLQESSAGNSNEIIGLLNTGQKINGFTKAGKAINNNDCCSGQAGGISIKNAFPTACELIDHYMRQTPLMSSSQSLLDTVITKNLDQDNEQVKDKFDPMAIDTDVYEPEAETLRSYLMKGRTNGSGQTYEQRPTTLSHDNSSYFNKPSPYNNKTSALPYKNEIINPQKTSLVRNLLSNNSLSPDKTCKNSYHPELNNCVTGAFNGSRGVSRDSNLPTYLCAMCGMVLDDESFFYRHLFIHNQIFLASHVNDDNQTSSNGNDSKDANGPISQGVSQTIKLIQKLHLDAVAKLEGVYGRSDPAFWSRLLSKGFNGDSSPAMAKLTPAPGERSPKQNIDIHYKNFGNMDTADTHESRKGNFQTLLNADNNCNNKSGGNIPKVDNETLMAALFSVAYKYTDVKGASKYFRIPESVLNNYYAIFCKWQGLDGNRISSNHHNGDTSFKNKDTANGDCTKIANSLNINHSSHNLMTRKTIPKHQDEDYMGRLSQQIMDEKGPNNRNKNQAFKYTKEQLQSAITAVINGQKTVVQASKTYGIPYRTLYDYIRNYKCLNLEDYDFNLCGASSNGGLIDKANNSKDEQVVDGKEIVAQVASLEDTKNVQLGLLGADGNQILQSSRVPECISEDMGIIKEELEKSDSEKSSPNNEFQHDHISSGSISTLSSAPAASNKRKAKPTKFTNTSSASFVNQTGKSESESEPSKYVANIHSSIIDDRICKVNQAIVHDEDFVGKVNLDHSDEDHEHGADSQPLWDVQNKKIKISSKCQKIQAT